MQINHEAMISPLNLSEQRAKRLRQIRRLLRLSRKAIFERYKIPVGTLQNWEDARHGGLTEKGAQRIIEILADEGISCSLEWLLFGIGNPPNELRSSPSNKIMVNAGLSQEIQLLDDIAKELTLFYSHNANAVDVIISDDAMEPRYLMGDHVAGKRFFNEDIAKIAGHVCIVQTQNGLITVRILLKGSQPGCYDLIAYNKNSAIKDLNFFNVRVFSAAPIIWIRRTISLS